MILRINGNWDEDIERKIKVYRKRNLCFEWFRNALTALGIIAFFTVLVTIIAYMISYLLVEYSITIAWDYSLAIMQVQSVISALSITVTAFITVTHNQQYYGFYLADFIINLMSKPINIKTIIIACLVMVLFNPFLVLLRRPDLFLAVFVISTTLILFMMLTVIKAISSSKKSKKRIYDYSLEIVKMNSKKITLNDDQKMLAMENIELAASSKYCTHTCMNNLEEFFEDLFEDTSYKLNVSNSIGFVENAKLISEVYEEFVYSDFNLVKEYVFDLFNQRANEVFYISRIAYPYPTFNIITGIYYSVNLKVYNNKYQEDSLSVLKATDLKYSIDAWIDSRIRSWNFGISDIYKIIDLIEIVSNRIILMMLFSEIQSDKELDTFRHTISIMTKAMRESRYVNVDQRDVFSDFYTKLVSYKVHEIEPQDYKFSNKLRGTFAINHFIGNIKENGKFESEKIEILTKRATDVNHRVNDYLNALNF